MDIMNGFTSGISLMARILLLGFTSGFTSRSSSFLLPSRIHFWDISDGLHEDCATDAASAILGIATEDAASHFMKSLLALEELLPSRIHFWDISDGVHEDWDFSSRSL